ncbi:MAG TPA: hypothetical protein VMC43_01215 [Candidatus Paceibacterota bacterium]|nr:hypothetical protein [Candidatus Paceibacterota bacterium]
MPDIQPNFEQFLESDIEHLSAEMKNRREQPEIQGVSHQEVLKQAVQSMTPPPAPPAAANANVIQDPLPNYAKDAPPETRLEVEQLLEMAFREGIMKANAAAARSNPYVLDTFHDALVGKLYSEFQKRGLLE